jgi:hypothetical protein
MKISWGYKILIMYSLFVAGILTMVFLSSQQNRDLVSDDYYAEELAYQHVIDQSAHTASLSSPVEITQSETILMINFPSEFDDIISKGKWILYYAADIKKDVKGTFEVRNGFVNIKVPTGAYGLYLLKIEWASKGISYYYEKQLHL